MAGLCEGGNECACSLTAICKQLFVVILLDHWPPAPVFEVTDFTNPPPLLQPSRPVTRPPNNYRPIDGPRPGGPGIFTGPDGPRPVGPGVLTGPDGPRPGGSGIFTGPDNQRPGGSGILTGPVPSWEQRPGDKYAYKDYEHCNIEFNERIPNLTGEQSDGITVFRIPPMTSLMLHRCRTGAISLQRWWQSPSAAISESDWFLYRAGISRRMTSCTVVSWRCVLL
ncbi:hypothetical protein ANN_26600 [Periplaneta americana]|uniref:Uncharacterized protein n=1 Tax=Periplaneta americana TaxID=6978 RepID=A0ABQ8RZ78_PERAM|nr:hypothetical protein ANN_26600 [Periplaneta americana]